MLLCHNAGRFLEEITAELHLVVATSRQKVKAGEENAAAVDRRCCRCEQGTPSLSVELAEGPARFRRRRGRENMELLAGVRWSLKSFSHAAALREREQWPEGSLADSELPTTAAVRSFTIAVGRREKSEGGRNIEGGRQPAKDLGKAEHRIPLPAVQGCSGNGDVPLFLPFSG
nr:hypothetical protein Itr_chr07CG10400 [Ipomoea trifida]